MSESARQSLRHLAAARFYLPMTLKGGEKSDIEEQYRDFLHNREYRLALGELEEFGLENPGFAEEAMFWKEMELAAASLGMLDKARDFARRAAGS